ncbi:unnamed protein product [Closterium sp. Naga37s-1]|nr:unnamed protein product [Closterium sp. Naga37s-1]
MLTSGASHTISSELMLELLSVVAPLWLAVVVGLILGWSWRPRWVNSLASDPRSSAFLSLLTGGPFKEAWSAGWSWGQAVLDSCGHVQVPGFPAAGVSEGVKGAKEPGFQAVGVLFGRDWSSLGEKVLPWRAAERVGGSGKSKLVALGSDGAEARRPEGAEEVGERRNGNRVVGPASGAADSRRERQVNGEAVSKEAVTDEPSVQSRCKGSRPSSLQTGNLQLLEVGRNVHGHTNGHAYENGQKHGHGAEHSVSEEDMELVLTEDDLEEFCAKVEGKDGGPEWQPMMEKTAKGMQYTGWRRDPEQGPTEYRSRTVMERCSSALMRDFFWDDEFRAAWDDMLVQARTITACERTGFQIVHWVRKDREYVIARRIWSHDDTFYCITKGVHHPEVPKRDKPPSKPHLVPCIPSCHSLTPPAFPSPVPHPPPSLLSVLLPMPVPSPVLQFPFFCKDREYVIARRIWSHDDTFYCITKGVHHPEVPKRDKPRRVEVFYSSWRIRPVIGAEGSNAAEVMLFHHEEMGLQRDIAKLGVRQGMWSAVRKMEPAIRKYEKQRAEAARPFSRCVSMANLHTPIVPSPGSSQDGEEDGEEGAGGVGEGSGGVGRKGGLKKKGGMGMRKWVSFSDLAMAGEARRRGGAEEDEEREKGRRVVDEAAEGEEQGSSGRAGSSQVVVASGSANAGARSPGEGSTVGSGDGRGRRRSGSAQQERSDSCDRGSEVTVRNGPIVGGDAQGEERRGKKAGAVRVGWVVATTALAFICGVEAGVLMKLVVAGAVQNVASRRAAAAGRKERLQN